MFSYKKEKESSVQEQNQKQTFDCKQKKVEDKREARYTSARQEKGLPNIRQAKSIRSLQQELEQLEIEDPEILAYAEQYDDLENTDLTKSDQMQILKQINERLSRHSEFKYAQAMKLIHTEMHIVLNQNMLLPLKRPSLWKQIVYDENAGCVYRLIVKYDALSVKNTMFAINLLTEARDFAAQFQGQNISLREETKKIIDREIKIIKNYMVFPFYTTEVIRSHAPYEAMENGYYWKIIESFQPDLTGMNVKGKIKALSEKHLHFLDDLFGETLMEATDRDYLLKTFYAIKEQVKTVIKSEGMLAHYSHATYLTTLESNDQLRESGMLRGTPLNLLNINSETFGADKTQEFDKVGIGNTGFVFCFLEKANAPLRNSRFGKNRYTKALGGSDSILNDAWAIMNDLADTTYNSHPYAFTKNDKEEIIKRDVITNDPYDDLQPPYTTTEIPDGDEMDFDIMYSSLMNFQNSLKKMTFFNTGDTSVHFKERELGSNFLYGPHILEGIAARTAAELAFAHVKLGARIDQFKTDSEALWNYIRQVVFKIQIMIPLKVLPDFVQKESEAEEEIVTVYPSEYETIMEISQRGNMGQKFQMVTANPVLGETVGGNNNFFACVRAVAAPGLSPEQLREDFRQKDGVDLDDTEPVTLDHIRKFAELYGIQIKVYIYVQGGRAIPVVYNQGAEPSCAVALFLPRLRYEGDNPVGLFVPVKVES